MSDLRSRAAAADGQTLVELLVVMVLGLISLFAVLLAMETFGRASVDQTALTDAQDAARREVEVIGRALRGAQPPTPGTSAVVLPTAVGATSTNDLTFGRVVDGAGTEPVVVLQRYCLASGGLYAEQVPTAVAGRPCPSAGGAGRLVTGLTNDASRPVFTLDAQRTAVGIELALGARRVWGTPRDLTVRSAARLRAGTGTPVSLAASDMAVRCSADRSKAVLSLGVAGGSQATFATTAGVVLGRGEVTVPLALSGPATSVMATVTSAAGVISQITKLVDAGACT